MTSAKTTDNMIPAMDGCLRGSITYSQLLRLIQTGRVLGCRRGRNWFVDAPDLARWKHEQDRAASGGA